MEELSTKELEAIIEQGMIKQETILQADPAMLFQVLREYHPLTGIFFPAGEPVPAFDNGKIRGNGRRLEIAMTTITMTTMEGSSLIQTTSKAIIFEVKRLSDKQTLVTGKYLPEAKPYFESLWQNMIQAFPVADLPTSGTGDGQGKGASAEGKRKLKYRAELRQNLTERFNRDELRTLCFDLGIEHENLPETKDGMARELVACCERTGSISALIAKCKELRPHMSWDDMPDAARKVW